MNTKIELTTKVASLNVWTAKSRDKHFQAIREPLIKKFIEQNIPFSIGVQECEPFWQERLDEILKGYKRAQNVTTTKNYIYYREDRLKDVNQGVFWLSETSDIPSKGFGSDYFISCCWAIFESIDNGIRFVHMNTHLDVHSEEIRLKELDVLFEHMNQFKEQGYAIILTGDFNSLEDTETYRKMKSWGLTDVRFLLDTLNTEGTFNRYDKNIEKYYGPIDYIMVFGKIKVEDYYIVDKIDNNYLSDHNAIISKININN